MVVLFKSVYHSTPSLFILMLDFGSKTTRVSLGGGPQISTVFPPMMAVARSPLSPKKVTRYDDFFSVVCLQYKSHDNYKHNSSISTINLLPESNLLHLCIVFSLVL